MSGSSSIVEGQGSTGHDGSLIRILFIEDDPVDRMAIERFVRRNCITYDYTVTSTFLEALNHLKGGMYDIIISDYSIGDGTAFDVIEAADDVPVIVVTGTGNEKVAVEAMRRGAFDYLIKDIDRHYLAVLPATVDNALGRKRAEKALERSRRELKRKVKERTAKLAEANQTLVKEVTERKRAEGELQKLNEELEKRVEERTRELRRTQDRLLRKERLSTLGRIAGSVAHDLRNPLGVIANSTHFIDIRLGGNDKKLEKHLKIIRLEVERSNRIITQLHDFSRETRLRIEDTEINCILRDTLSDIMLPTGITFELALDEGLPPIPADPEKLHDVFLNLVTNAIQAMPDGGRLAIGSRITEGALEVSIVDTGEGIHTKNLPKVFEPLFTTRMKNIGLGLAIAKDIVERHGGNIEVESELGRGTTFSVRLPPEHHDEPLRSEETTEGVR